MVLVAVEEAKTTGELLETCDAQAMTGLLLLLPQLWERMTRYQTRAEREQMLHRFLDFIYQGAMR